MAITRSTDPALIKPLDGAIIRRYTTASAIEGGETVYLDGSGYAALTDAAAVATNYCIGVAINDIASGARGDFVVFGPIVNVHRGHAGRAHLHQRFDRRGRSWRNGGHQNLHRRCG